MTSTDASPLAARQNLIDALYEQGLIPRIDVVGGVREVAFSADGRSLYAVSASEQAVRQWNVDRSTRENPFGFERPPKPRGSADLAPARVLARIERDRVDGSVTMDARTLRLAATGRKRNDVGVWDMSERDNATRHERFKLLHRHDVVVALSYDGRWLVTRHYQRNDVPASLWDLSAKPPRRIALSALSGRGGLGAAAFSPDGATLATTMRLTNGVQLWSPSALSVQADAPPIALDVSRTAGVLMFDPSGDSLIAGKRLWQAVPKWG